MKKLQLRKETVQVLTKDNLMNFVGGNRSQSDWDPTNCCMDGPNDPDNQEDSKGMDCEGEPDNPSLVFGCDGDADTGDTGDSWGCDTEGDGM